MSCYQSITLWMCPLSLLMAMEHHVLPWTGGLSSFPRTVLLGSSEGVRVSSEGSLTEGLAGSCLCEGMVYTARIATNSLQPLFW